VATGERTDVTLGALRDGFTDPSTRISPDGRKVVFTDRTSGTGVRRLLDVATGATLDIGRLNEILYADSWAADSSGIFTEEDGSIAFHPVDSANRVVVEGVDGIASVATRRVPSGG
jgi:Tol biopolymer transport system component